MFFTRLVHQPKDAIETATIDVLYVVGNQLKHLDALLRRRSQLPRLHSLDNEPVSYTHLDVYKRQIQEALCLRCHVGFLEWGIYDIAV